MRDLRLLIWFLFGVFLVGVPMLSFAETSPAIPSTTNWLWGTTHYASPAVSWSAAILRECPVGGSSGDYVFNGESSWTGVEPLTGLPNGLRCKGIRPWDQAVQFYPAFDMYRGAAILTCPSGGDWTLSGSTCTRADRCVATGVAAQGFFPMGTSATNSPPAVVCAAGCLAVFSGSSPAGQRLVDGKTQYFASGSYDFLGGGNLDVCTAGTTSPAVPSSSPALPSDACATGQVKGTFNGQTMCVDKGTGQPVDPATPVAPAPSTDTKVERTPTTTTTTTTTTSCTVAGSCTTTINQQITSGGSGPNGTGPGSTTQPGPANGQATEESKDSLCAKTPSLQICKGGMNEEATQKKVLSEIEKLNKPDSGDDSLIKGAVASVDAEKALSDAYLDTADYSSGYKSDPLVAAKRSAWEMTMSSGWWQPISIAGCSPFSGTIAGRSWTIDICPTAAKISEIGAYCAWVLLMFSAFRMLTATPSTRS